MKKEQLKTKDKIKKYAARISTVLLALIMLSIIATSLSLFMQVAKGKRPSVFGYRFYYILTDSMVPEIQPRDVILSKVYNTEEELMTIQNGDVITYIGEEGDIKGVTITHKVVEPPYVDSTGRKVLITRGTKAGAKNDPPVPLENIQAVMIKKMAVVGAIYRFSTSTVGIIAIIIVPMIGIIGLLVMRLINTAKSKEQEKPRTAEEIARQAVEEFKEQERLKAEIAKKAVEEYKKENNELEPK